jgi:hypothetical protein
VYKKEEEGTWRRRSMGSPRRFLENAFSVYYTKHIEQDSPPFSYIYAFGRKIRKIDIAHVHQQHRDSFEYGMKDFGV